MHSDPPENLFAGTTGLSSYRSESENLLARAMAQVQVVKTKVFLVHGHNNDPVNELGFYLQREKLEVTVLRDEVKQGRSIIEQLFALSTEAGFAVVLFTGDDEGRKKGASSWEDRARQNVVFEAGFFLGKLGKNRVCAVVEPGVKLPSDLDGILHIEYVKGSTWKHDVLREIKVALKL